MIEAARNICIELLRKTENPSPQDINQSIDDVLKIFPGLLSEREALFKYLNANFRVFSGFIRALDADQFIPWLKDRKADIQWNFWNRYVNSIRNKIAPNTIIKLDNSTDDILTRIGNPLMGGAWDKKGMVVGQVQSGKTGNYTGLINKATDAGYKLIVVLAGTHEILRSQTQIRIDKGFLGFNTQHSLDSKTSTNKIGVGFYNPINEETNTPVEMPASSLTKSELNGDFKRGAETNRISLRSTDPIVAVIKKNVSIMKNLISWLAVWGERQPDGKIIIRNLPFLLIDDEADNASINVNKDKVSATNGCIRALLSLFEQSSYVGYTATPFANIFIPISDEKVTKGLNLKIRDYEFTVGQDLFPKDFIINIPAPSNYIGPARIFGLPAQSSAEKDEDPLPLIRTVKDYTTFNASNIQEQIQYFLTGIEDNLGITKSFVPNKHKKNDTLPDELPPSLKYAVRCFIISAAARRVRKQNKEHNSMLVHISRFIAWQDRIASLVDAELKFCQQQTEMKSGNLLRDLKLIWDKEFVPTTNQILNDTHIYMDPEITSISWEELKPEIYPAISKMEVRAVHGDKNVAGLSYHNISPLDYFTAEERGQYLSIIAVGGDKLSRGLTLEGLTVSYYLRASKMYDTLMQMGRWFGYRPGYVDLCRIFTSGELKEWYKHITIASEEMRKDFDYMFLLNKTPRDFGLKVRTDPKGNLKITAINKFRYRKIIYLSYSGELAQTYQFKINKNNFKSNYDEVNNLISGLGAPLSQPLNTYNSKQKFIWQGENNYDSVISFLSKYKIGSEVIDNNRIVDYITAQTKKGNLINWTIAVINNSTAKPEHNFNFNNIGNVGLTDRTNINTDTDTDIYAVAKYNITDQRHELIDLSKNEIEIAKSQTEADYKENGETDVPELPSRKRIKWARSDKKGLLIIYPLNPDCLHIADTPTKPKPRRVISKVPVIGIAVSFPEIENDEKIEYAANEQFRKEFEYDDEIDQSELNDETD